MPELQLQLQLPPGVQAAIEHYLARTHQDLVDRGVIPAPAPGVTINYAAVIMYLFANAPAIIAFVQGLIAVMGPLPIPLPPVPVPVPPVPVPVPVPPVVG